jgi:hypothetical protein
MSGIGSDEREQTGADQDGSAQGTQSKPLLIVSQPWSAGEKDKDQNKQLG